MNEFKIIVCEDKEGDYNLIDAYIKMVGRELTNYKLVVVRKNFNDILDPDLLSGSDLLILDMYEDNEKKGESVLTYIGNLEKKPPTIIYSGEGSRSATADSPYAYSVKYNFVHSFIEKSDKGDVFKKALKGILLKKNDFRSFELYNENDIFLLSDIRSIGENFLSQIVVQIKEEFKITDKPTIYRMSSGFSGAAIFKLKVNNGETIVLKVSKDIEKLKTEHLAGVNFYHQFPNRLINHIDIKEYYTFDKEALGIVIKEVVDSQTFFSFLNDKSTEENTITTYLSNLFVENQSLKTHYGNNLSDQKKSWLYIFQKINESKFTLIEYAILELEPLIDSGNISEIKNLVRNSTYGKIDKNKLLDDHLYVKPLILCHGDLHSKNILIQGNHPVIIDTGGIKYDFWCIDLCRLITNLFISGFDNGTKEYFDINKINENLEIASKFIKFNKITTDGKNDNFIIAINWLIENAQNIYGELFSQWEFQLGLMKEFLQISYRVDSIPPNKRAIALLSAVKCMEFANESLSLELG